MKTPKISHFIKLNERVVFLRLLFRWNGSIWRHLWVDLVTFIVSYFLVTLIYRCVLIDHPSLKTGFEGFVTYMNKIANLVPVTFLLGFFVSTILTRWWSFVRSIPGMTSPAFLVHAFIVGEDEDVDITGFLIRRTLMRYMNLAWILAMMKLSWSIRRRFMLRRLPEMDPPLSKFNSIRWTKKGEKPKTDCYAPKKNKKATSKRPLVRTAQMIELINSDASVKKFFGQIITQEEADIFIQVEKEEGDGYIPEAWLPLKWCFDVLRKAQKMNCLVDDRSFNDLIRVINDFRASLGTISTENRFNIPLVYTQAIIIVVYSFFLSEVFSQQFITPSTAVLPANTNRSLLLLTSLERIASFDSYVPIASIVKFLIYMGWFKIGLSLLNPLREDQSQFPMEEILESNLRMSIKIALCPAYKLPASLQADEATFSTALQQEQADAHQVLIEVACTDSNQWEPRGVSFRKSVRRTDDSGDEGKSNPIDAFLVYPEFQDDNQKSIPLGDIKV